MIEIGTDFFVGVGNTPGNSDGGAIARISPAGDVTVECQLDEQGVVDMHLHDGKLYVPGTDPTDGWDLGNIYIRQSDGEWIKRRTLPLTIHCFGACHDGNGDLWAACGCHTGDNKTWEGRVMRSVDDGLTWDRSTVLTDYRVYSIAFHDGKLYSVGTPGFAPTGDMYSTNDGGVTWERENPLNVKWYQRPVVKNHHLVYLGLVSNDRGEWLQRSLPFSIPRYAFNCLATADNDLYALDDTGYIWRTSDLATWQLYSQVPNAISLGYWPSQNCLVVSDKGTQAKLWRIPI